MIILLLTLTFAACRIAEPTSTSLPRIPSPTSPQLPTDIPATQTPTPTRAVTPPTRTPQPDPLDNARELLTELEIYLTSEYSPDNQWEVKRLLAFPITDESRQKYNNQFYSYLKITCVSQSCGPNVGLEWILVDQWSEAEIGYHRPETLGWSADEKILYLYDSIIPDGCQPLGGFQGNLRRVDLGSGNVEQIPLRWTGGIAISPDSRYLSYYDQSTVEVGIYDVESGEEKRLPFDLDSEDEMWFAGDFTWSPDAQGFLFRILHASPCFPTGTSIIRVDLQKGTVQTILQENGNFFDIVEWVDANRVLLNGEREQQWWLNPLTGELTAKDNE